MPKLSPVTPGCLDSSCHLGTCQADPDLARQAEAMFGDRVRVLSAAVTPANVGRMPVHRIAQASSHQKPQAHKPAGSLAAAEVQALLANVSGKTWLEVDKARS